MRRGRGKGEKLTVSNHDDGGSGEEEELKIPAQKRRGRPQKPLKDDIDDEEVKKIEDNEDGVLKNGKGPTENGKKRRRNSQQAKEKPDSVKEEATNGVVVIGGGTKSTTNTDNDSTKAINGFRQNGSRRKSKPHRAAEAGVECRRSGVMI